MNLVNGITFFIKEPEAGPEVFQAAIKDGIVGPEALFEEYDRHFNFPHFGFNWDALDECLRDLQWISQPQIIITHHTLPELAASDFNVYLEVLCDAIESWRNCKELIKERLKEAQEQRDSESEDYWRNLIEHGLEVRFNLADEKLVKSAASEAKFVKYLAGESGWVKYFV